MLSAALTRVYEDAGWDLALGEPRTAGVTPGYPGLADLQRTAGQVVGEIGYSEDVKADVHGFVTVRLSSLRLGTTGRFLEGGHPVDFGKLLRSNAVLEIEDVGDDRDKAFLMGTVLLRLVEHLRLARRHETGAEPGLRHLTVFEEAHRLLRRPDRDGGAAAHAVELFAGLLAEIRAYGEGIVIAEQIPAKLIPDVIKNTAVKIVHRLPAADDREAVGATMNLSRAQSQYLVTLAPGQAAVSVDGMDHPLLVMMPDGTAREAAAGTDGTASPATVTSARSGTCGADCIARPCTLRDMRDRPAHPGPPSRHCPVGRACRAVPPDRMADADTASRRCWRYCAPCRRGCGTVRCRTASTRRSRSRVPLICARVSPPGPRLARRYRDAGPGGAGHVDVPAGRAAVARARVTRTPTGRRRRGGRPTWRRGMRTPRGGSRSAWSRLQPWNARSAPGPRTTISGCGSPITWSSSRNAEWPHRYLKKAEPEPRADRPGPEPRVTDPGRLTGRAVPRPR